MLTLKTWSAIVVVLIAALSVLSDASPVTATDRHRDKNDNVTVTNKSGNPVPVIIGNGKGAAVPVSVTNWPAQTGGGATTTPGGAAPEDGAQFFREGVTFASVANADLFASRPGKRFVVDYLTITANLTAVDCSLAFVRVYDGFAEVSRVVMPLQGNAANLFGATQAVKMYVDAAVAGANPNRDPIQRIDAMLFPVSGCSATDFKLSVAGHYVDRP